MKQIQLILLSLCLLFCVSGKSQTQSYLRAPAYPLVTIDPYTSCWSFGDKLYEDDTRHWTGEKHPLLGAIRVDGEIYRFMGTETAPTVPILNTVHESPWEARYTHEAPLYNWFRNDFNDSSWKLGKGAFGTPDMPNMVTRWEKGDIWVRRHFTLTEKDLENDRLFLVYSHDDVFELYINGEQVVNTGYAWKNDVIVPIPASIKKNLKKGENIIAAHCFNTMGGAYVDFGLMTEGKIESKMSRTAAQIEVNMTPTQTNYAFYCGPVRLDLTFTSPLVMDDLDLLSRPVNYITYQVSSLDENEHDVQLYFDATPEWAVNVPEQPVQSNMYSKNGLTFLQTGTKEQKILGYAGDNVRIDWGYFYLVGKQNKQTSLTIGESQSVRNQFVASGKLPSYVSSNVSSDMKKEMPVLAYTDHLGMVGCKKVKGYVMLGYDDIESIQYFGKNLKPYWNTNGNQTIESVFSLAERNYDQVIKTCNEWDTRLMDDARQAGGQKYAEICAVSYRQAVAAHKLVTGTNGELFFFSKENFSNGSIGTVDISFPSCPLFLLYNNDLAKAMMNFIFDYCESGKWSKPFVPHDVGTYPLANGQTYMGDMPVEETGNMMLMIAAATIMDGNASYAEKHWKMLTKWADYLAKNGLDPDNQLCTEDFAGYMPHNVNLSVKAIVAIGAFGKIAEIAGKKDVAKKYTEIAKKMAAKCEQMANDGDHFRLAFDQPNTWSQKYNFVWHKMFGLDIFSKNVIPSEVSYYMKKINEYGLPLDNRYSWTIVPSYTWTATMADNLSDFNKLMDPMWKYINESPVRVPLGDWYDTKDGQQINFRARSIVGGVFSKTLNDVMQEKLRVIDEKTSGNPILPGWYADPEGIVYGDECWIYPTLSDCYNNGKPVVYPDKKTRAVHQIYNVQTYMDAFSSKDLVNWKKHPKVLSIENIKWLEFALWAPSVISANGKYYLFFGANDIQSNDEYGGIGVAVSDKPSGPFVDAIGKPLVNKFVNGAQPIDQFVFRDSDGEYYMYYGGWHHCNMVRLSKDLLSVIPFEDGTTYKEVTPESYVEGPFMLKRNGTYYFMWSEGSWGGPDYSVAYAMSDSPFGPFKRIGKILQQDPAIATGAGHHSVIQIPGKDEYYIVYHRKPLGDTDQNHRETCIDHLYFNTDGTIKPVKMTNEGVTPRLIK